MKRLLLFLVVALFLGIINTQAQDSSTKPSVMMVNTTDGNVYRFAIEQSEDDTLLFFNKGTVSEEELKVSYVVYQNEAWIDQELVIQRENVKDITFDLTETNSIRQPTKEQKAVTFNLKADNSIAIIGLKTGDVVSIVKVDGRNVLNTKAQIDGTVTINLSHLSTGVYVVSVNKRFTFKLMKP